MVKSNKQKGGVFPKKGFNSEEAFRYFINNCTTELLSSETGYGIILKCTLKPEKKSPYQTFRPSSLYNEGLFQKDIRIIIVKIVLIYHIKDFVIILPITKKEKRTDTNEGFLNEIIMQTKIAIKTSNYLEPVCPIPVYSELCNNLDITKRILYLKIFYESSDIETKKYITDIINIIISNPDSLNYGIFSMELTNGYEQLWKYVPEISIVPDLELSKKAADLSRHSFIRLAASGYIQGDSHPGNVMINLKTPKYYKHEFGNSIILDYGMAKNIKPEIKELAKRTITDPSSSRIKRCLDAIAYPPGGRPWINNNPNFDNIKRLINIRLKQEKFFNEWQPNIFPLNTKELLKFVETKYIELYSQVKGLTKADYNRRFSRISIESLQQEVKTLILKGFPNIESLILSNQTEPMDINIPLQIGSGITSNSNNKLFDKKNNIEKHLILSFINILSLGLESLQDVIIATKEVYQTKKISKRVTGLSSKEIRKITPISVFPSFSKNISMVAGSKKKKLKKLFFNKNKKTKKQKNKKIKKQKI